MESLLTRGDLIDQILVQCQRARESRERGEEENADKRKKRRRKKIFSSSSSPSFSSSSSSSIWLSIGIGIGTDGKYWEKPITHIIGNPIPNYNIIARAC